MNATAEFVRWVRSNHRPVYDAAVRRVSRKTSLGGLGDDLTSDVSFDPGSISVSDSASSAIDNAVSSGSSSSGSWSSLLDSLSSAITTVAPTIVQTDAQIQLINANAARAAHNLSPLGAGSLFGTGGMSSSTLLIGGGVLLGAFLLMSRKSRG